MSGNINNASRLQGLQRENGLLQEQLRSKEELNATLRSELELHRSIMAQASSHHQEQEQGHDQEVSGPQTEAQKQDGDIISPQTAEGQPHMMNSGKLHVISRMICIAIVFNCAFHLAFVRVSIRPAGRTFAGNQSFTTTSRRKHSHQRLPEGTVGEEAG